MSVRRGITIHDAPCRDTHRGLMRALFLTLSHGKFAHGIFRSAALLKQATKKRLPSILKLGGD